MSLRERKKEQTRQLIADTARRLLAERGFDAVTVAEVAREADVSEKTVFNYFPTKEELFYSRLEAFEEELLQALTARAPGARKHPRRGARLPARPSAAAPRCARTAATRRRRSSCARSRA